MDPLQEPLHSTRGFVTWGDFQSHTPDKRTRITTKELDKGEYKSHVLEFFEEQTYFPSAT